MDLPFKTLAVLYDAGTRVATFSVDDPPGIWIQPIADTIDIVAHTVLSIYGIPYDSDDDDYYDDNDEERYTQPEYFSNTGVLIGKIFGAHIPTGLIINLGGDPYEACDAQSEELEAMYSVIEEYSLVDEVFDNAEIYYLHEIELKPEYQNMGYELVLLKQLPSIIVTALRVFPSLILYFPRPTQIIEREPDLEVEEVFRHRASYNLREVLEEEEKSNVAMFPPLIRFSKEREEKEINRLMGKRDPGSIIPIKLRNRDVYNLYKSAGFTEAGQSGWLYKIITDIRR